MLFFQSDHVIWIFQEGAIESSMPMQFLSSFLVRAYSMISHATHQLIRRIQSRHHTTCFDILLYSMHLDYKDLYILTLRGWLDEFDFFLDFLNSNRNIYRN